MNDHIKLELHVTEGVPYVEMTRLASGWEMRLVMNASPQIGRIQRPAFEVCLPPDPDQAEDYLNELIHVAQSALKRIEELREIAASDG